MTDEQLLEAEYWKQIVSDVGTLAAQLVDIAAHITDASVANLSLVLLIDDRARPFVLDIMAAANAALRGTLAAQQTLERMLGLIDGRVESWDAT
jgi:hypothetical protein